LVEHHLAKVDVESSSLFARSISKNRWKHSKRFFRVGRAMGKENPSFLAWAGARFDAPWPVWI
jgi:hypothetical protein